jgi:inhibitor of cysteine peptidase
MAKATMPTFSAKDANISVKAGAPFQIRLDVTSGNGYTWRASAPLPPGLTLLGDFQTPRGKRMPGGPGQQVLVFRAADVGSLKLSLQYVRPWEHGVKPAKTQTFAVTVHK